MTFHSTLPDNTSQSSNESTTPIQAILPIYLLFTLFGIIVGGFQFFALSESPINRDKYLVRTYRALVIVSILMSLISTILSAISWSNPVERNIAGAHVNIGTDITTLIPFLVSFYLIICKTSSTGTWILTIAAAILGLVGFLSSLGSIKSTRDGPLGKLSPWWIGLICWLLGSILWALGEWWINDDGT